MASILLLSSILAFSTAQTTTLTLPFYGYDDMPIVGSIVSADSSATILQLACVEGTDASDCGLFPYQTLTYGPSTYHMDMSVPGDGFTMTQDCVVATSSAVCKESAGGSEANDPGSSTTTYEGSDVTGLPVTVTSGAEKLTASAPLRPTASATTGSGASQTAASVTGLSGTRSATVATSRSSTGPAASASSTGAAAANGVALGSGFVGAVGFLGGLLL
ncbi:hypothetical protein BDV96DRAFT_84102 [Lophiotrema nucula]|uniref:GPI anchored protein n=1 Tax=Lophiotrema nucula TaxID=690887 RepID=A0A6A5Z6F0_9PLEO|nr:hypothetical protein BDV96DRAFT_84102 [Lophiotrema nucula]